MNIEEVIFKALADETFDETFQKELLVDMLVLMIHEDTLALQYIKKLGQGDDYVAWRKSIAGKFIEDLEKSSHEILVEAIRKSAKRLKKIW